MELLRTATALTLPPRRRKEVTMAAVAEVKCILIVGFVLGVRKLSWDIVLLIEGKMMYWSVEEY